MKYYGFTCKGFGLFNTDKYDIEKFMVKANADKTVYKLCFDESTREEFFIAIDYENNFKKQNREVIYIGEDRYLYAFMPDGSVEKRTYFSKKAEKKNFTNLNHFEKKRAREDKVRQRLVKEAKIGMTHIGKGIGDYDKYVYYDGKSDFVIPFRFKKAKSENAPLLVYFAGAGTLGHDNFKQLAEYKNLIRHLPEDCNVLIPQAYFGINGSFMCDTMLTEYINSTIDIILNLSEKFSIDDTRRYCVGTSFGGSCVWECIYSHENIFSATVPVMGLLLNYNKKLPKLVENYKGLPIWIAHSSDDTNVSIASDDTVYAELKKLNPDIKYTRWNKYNHKMANHFYKKVSYKQWLFKQKRIFICH